METKIAQLVLFILVIPVFTIAQEAELYESLHYKNAVKNGTRSRTGKPGPNYWQNHADYNIKVELDTALKKISGQETIKYYNESPDTLKQVVLRLYPNRYKIEAKRDEEVNPLNINEGMQLDTLVINGKGIALINDNMQTNGTNLLVNLPVPLPPHSTLELACKWNYKPAIGEEFRRTGYYKDNAWFIGYFYPQIAVYDDLEYFKGLKGWDYYLFHGGMNEFYNDFNNYKVRISVPEGYYVWATGELQHPEEYYAEEILKRLEKAKLSDTSIFIIPLEDIGKYKPLSSTWRYEAQNLPDFAFGTSPNYLWEGTSVNLGERSIFVDIAYHPKAIYFPLALNIARATLEYASNTYPGIEYPYSHSTTFNGMLTGGMEFPMIANNMDGFDTAFFAHMTSHEIIHNYTPFMLGMNEKRYQFMDEGFAPFFTDHFLLDIYELETMGSRHGTIMDDYSYSSKLDDYPLFNSFSQLNIHNSRYYYFTKPYLALRFFADMIGRNNFKLAFKEFANRWKGKHPTPWDMFYTFNDALGENYNWYWKAWYFDLGYPDLALHLNNTTLSVKRLGVGSLPLPVKIIIEKTDGSVEMIEKSTKVWKDGAKEIIVKLTDIENITSIRLDPESIPDIDRSNNIISVQ